ncbi:MAG: hypothetical protein WCL49_00270 [bacterium]
MDKLNIELCPETGICSIIKKNGTKVDLMPDEVKSLRKASSDPGAARQVLAEADADFAKSLDPDELKQLATQLK